MRGDLHENGVITVVRKSTTEQKLIIDIYKPLECVTSIDLGLD